MSVVPKSSIRPLPSPSAVPVPNSQPINNSNNRPTVPPQPPRIKLPLKPSAPPNPPLPSVPTSLKAKSSISPKPLVLSSPPPSDLPALPSSTRVDRTFSDPGVVPPSSISFIEKKERSAPIQPSTSNNSAELSVEEEDYFLVIESPSHGVEITSKFAPTTTIGQVVTAFLEKYPVTAKQKENFGLKHVKREPSNSRNSLEIKQQRKKENEHSEWLPKHLKLKDSKVGNLGHVIIVNQQEERDKFSSKTTMKKSPNFGVDPSHLPLIDDCGFKVPKILALLRQSLEKYNAFEEEGIFRLAGSENKMKEIKLLLNTGTFQDSNEVHCLANLVKRWFGELPNKLFHGISTERIQQAALDSEVAIEIPNEMSVLERDLFNWFMLLLSHAAKNSQVNKMTPHNLALVVAPQIAGINSDDPLSSIIQTQKVHHIVKFNIEHILLHVHGIQPSSVASAPSIDIERQLQQLALLSPPPVPFPTTSSSSSSQIGRGGSKVAPAIQIPKNIDKQGFLYKESSGIMKELQRRWFILEGTNLYYFSSGNHENLNGNDASLIDLKGASVKLLKSSHHSKYYYFQLITSLRTYHLYCDSSAEQQDWVHVLHHHITSHFESMLSPSTPLPSTPTPTSTTPAPNSSSLLSSSPSGSGISSAISKEGFVYKKSTGFGKSEHYSKKYCVLKQHQMNIYEGKGDVVPVESFPVISCKISDDVAKNDKEKDKSVKKHYFLIQTPAKTLHFCVDSKQDFESWSSAIGSASKELASSLPSTPNSSAPTPSTTPPLTPKSSNSNLPASTVSSVYSSFSGSSFNSNSTLLRPKSPPPLPPPAPISGTEKWMKEKILENREAMINLLDSKFFPSQFFQDPLLKFLDQVKLQEIETSEVDIFIKKWGKKKQELIGLISERWDFMNKVVLDEKFKASWWQFCSENSWEILEGSLSSKSFLDQFQSTISNKQK